MYLNDKLEIYTNKRDSFNLRIYDKCLKLYEDDILIFSLRDKDGYKYFEKRFFIYNNVAYLNISNEDISTINVGEYSYYIYIQIPRLNINDTIVYNNKFIMEV